MTMSVSIVILGRGRNLQETVDSACAQTLRPVEVLVVEPADRRLTQGTRHTFVRRGITLVSTALGSDSAALRNVGVRASRGHWVALLEPDDCLAECYLERAAGFTTTPWAFITSWSRLPGHTEVRSTTGLIDLRAIIERPELVHSSTLFRRETWESCAGFDETLRDDQMYDFWIRLLQEGGRGAVVEFPLLIRRPSSSAQAARLGIGARPASSITEVFEKHRATFALSLTDCLCERERHLADLDRSHTALKIQRAGLESQLSHLEAEVSSATVALCGVGRDRVEWGDFRRTTPLSADWGADRGRCIDRYYIEQFLEAHAGDIHGDVLEVHDDDYTRQYGGDRVRTSDVLDIDEANPRATVIGDLRGHTSLPSQSYDCVILTQTLHLIFDMRAVLRECVRILKSGGVLLATLPCLSRVAPEQGPDSDFWRFTESAARRLFEERFEPERIVVRSYGNVLVNIAFLYGLACDELTEREFAVDDPYFPLLVSVRAET